MEAGGATTRFGFFLSQTCSAIAPNYEPCRLPDASGHVDCFVSPQAQGYRLFSRTDMYGLGVVGVRCEAPLELCDGYVADALFDLWVSIYIPELRAWLH